MTRRWDLIVLGGGTAGLVGAQTAAALGARVVLVEADRPGGDCLWTGCVPSKSLIAAARIAASARRADRFGVRVGEVEVDFRAVMAHVHGAIAAIEPHDSAQTLRRHGIKVVTGRGRLTADGAVQVDGERLEGRRVLLATGSLPAVPAIDGLADCEPLTTDTVWDLEELPGRLTVLGGGNIGCELGQAFARLGSRVTIVETSPNLLAGEDPEASRLVTEALAADGVDVLTGVSAESVRGDPAASSGELTTTDGGVIAHDRLLVATGRRPNTADLGLAAVGIEVGDDGYVLVDEHLRTTNPKVWAAGDLTGHPQFTHVAGVHGSVAATNALLGAWRKAETAVVPRVTFTDPEVAAVGVGTDEATGDPGLRLVTKQHVNVDRAVTDGATGGFSRLVTDTKGRLVGATLVGPRAGEALPELVLAIGAGKRTRDLAGSIHAYPTFADGAWNAAIDDTMRGLARPAPRRAIRALLTARRWLPRR